jgi:heterogeneous nuclear ribonucleoprotein A1/A3
VFIGGLAHKTTTQHLRDHFSSFGGIVDAVVLRWPDGRSRGFGYVTFADVVAANAVLAESHMMGGREVDVKRAVPGTNKLFIGGLPQNTTANELREHFEHFGAVSDAVVMIDPATGRSRGFGFICFLPGEEGAAAVTLSLEKYGEHRLRGKWIEVKSAAPPHKLAKNGSDEHPSSQSSGKAPSSRRSSEEISLAGALPSSPRPAVENREPNEQKPVVVALGSPRKVTLPTDSAQKHAQSLPPGLVAPRHAPPMLSPEELHLHNQQLPWWPTQPWNPMFAPGLGFNNLPVDHMGHLGSRMNMPVYGADGWNTFPPGMPYAHTSASESLQKSLESFVREAMQNKMDSLANKTTPSVSTACSATTELDQTAPFCFDI